MNMIVAARRIAATTGPAVATCCSTTGNTASSSTSSSTRDIVMGDNNVSVPTSTGTMIHVARATKLLVAAAPGLLWSRPAVLPSRKACVAIIRLLHGNRTMCHVGLPRPMATDHDLLPYLASSSITVGWRIRRLAAFALLLAAPDLLGGRPRAAPIAQSSIAIKGCFAGSLFTAASCLDGACTAHIALHLNLAVGQIASIALGAKDVFLSPVDTLLAG